jgi:hypothetical protein
MAIKKKTTDAVVLTARQLLSGYTTDADRRWLWNTAPFQMVPAAEKDDDWKKWNMDWLEYIGLKQIMGDNRRLIKYYNMANGVIDKSDYIPTKDNPYTDIINTIVNETNSPFSLKFYPLAPSIINVLIGEFAKRDTRIIVKAVDEFSQNEAMEYKMSMVRDIILQDAQQKVIQKLKEEGIDENSEQGQQQINVAAQLAEAQIKYKNYRGIGEEWAQHTLENDQERFRLNEYEIEGFRDSLVADREFWHTDIASDGMDYKEELWNPIYTFYHKSPDTQYISQGNYVGQIKLMSIPDVIDIYGSMMNEEQLDELKFAQSVAMAGNNAQSDVDKHDPTKFWDASKPYDRQQPNSIHYEQYMGIKQMKEDMTGGSFGWNELDRLSLRNSTWSNQSMVRVSKVYWKSQKRVGHLIRIKDDGSVAMDIVDENYKVTTKPVYDKSIVNKESKDNLVYGEHIDWIWINEVWTGIKIGPNTTTYYQSRGFGFQAIYLDIKPLPFQFKGTNSLYGCKLPVEGKIFTERNSTSSGLIVKMQGSQIGYNIVNNQIMDILADETGKVVLIDQNMIPKQSLGGTWGKHNYPKFHQVMKDFGVALVDTSMMNTEGPGTSFQHFQQVDLSKTEMILSRLKIAEHFKNEAFSVVGITPQRLGSIQASESATGVQQAVNNSYAQTEIYFEQHMNFLMPRVKQMMIEAAQFCTANKIRKEGVQSVNYMNKKEEMIWFQIEEDKLLLRDFGIYPMSRANIKATVEKLKQVALENNTAGGSLYEIAQVITEDSPSQIIAKLKEADDKRIQQEQNQRDHDMEMQKMQQEFMENQRQKEQENEDYWKEREIQRDIYVAEIRATQSKSNDVNGNSIPDPLETDMFLHQQGLDFQDVIMGQQDLEHRKLIEQNKIRIEQEKLKMEKYKADTSLKIAKENKTKSELAKKKPKK